MLLCTIYYDGGTGDCRPRSPSGAVIIAEIHVWIRDREQVKIKGFIRTAAKLYNCVTFLDQAGLGRRSLPGRIGNVFALHRNRGCGYNYQVTTKACSPISSPATHTPL